MSRDFDSAGVADCWDWLSEASILQDEVGIVELHGHDFGDRLTVRGSIEPLGPGTASSCHSFAGPFMSISFRGCSKWGSGGCSRRAGRRAFAQIRAAM